MKKAKKKKQPNWVGVIRSAEKAVIALVILYGNLRRKKIPRLVELAQTLEDLHGHLRPLGKMVRRKVKKVRRKRRKGKKINDAATAQSAEHSSDGRSRN